MAGMNRIGGGWIRNCLVAAWVAIGLAGCGGGGAGSATETQAGRAQGQVLIALTDAEGDFSAYEVDVAAIRLTRVDGLVVDALPASGRIDFAAYTNLAELVSAASVPPGRYTGMSLTLDYSAAQILVEDATGAAQAAVEVLDIDGVPVDVLELPVEFDSRHPLVVAGRRTSMITLDFDLAASNQVSFEAAGPVVTVAPLLVADLDLQAPRMHRLRGGLVDVDVVAERFSIDLKPFNHAVGRNRPDFGVVDVNTNEKTVYEIHGSVYQGRTGLEALAGLDQGSTLVVRGRPERGGSRILAREVRAGDPVPGVELDAATGTVVAREGGRLTLNAVFLNRSDNILQRLDTLDVDLDTGSTRVLKQLSSQSHGVDDISIGQRVTVFGELAGSDLAGYELDATGGLVRMLLTTAKGVVLSAGAPTVIERQSLGGVRVGALDFSGTGIDSANDADPAGYEIDPGQMDVSNLDVGARVQINGFPVPFGQAVDGVADFLAQSVADLSTAPARLTVSWREPGGVALDAGSILLDVADATRFHHLSRAGVVSDLTLFSTQVRIAAREHEGVFLIQARGAPAHHRNFPDFVADLDSRLRAGSQVRRVQAYGDFDDTAAALAASWIKIQFD